MAKYEDYDFCGWATKNDLKCADGKIIRHGAFLANEGQKVPLIWNHQHGNPSAVLGHAYLENRPEGVYTYGYLNQTASGRDAKTQLQHGDIVALSIFANDLEQVGNQVLHGVIREVSLVLAGANPGARIESTVMHGELMDDGDTEGIIYTGDSITINSREELDVMENTEVIEHAATETNESEVTSTETEVVEHSATETKSAGKKTIGDIIDSMNEEQKAVLIGLLAEALKKGKKTTNSEEETEMKHSLFEANASTREVIGIDSDDLKALTAAAKRSGGSFKAAYEEALENGSLIHSIDTTGMDVATGKSDYGFNDPDMLFPDYKALNEKPEWISRKMEWVAGVLNGVNKTPFARVKTLFADITEDEARAKGYIKGNQKKTEVFTLLKRQTDPQTIYKKQKMDKDDIEDITSFDVIAWIKAEMQVMLDEEKARAILIGDGREDDDPDKIQEIHVRPIVKDVPLFNVKVPVQVEKTDDDEKIAKKTIKAILRARKEYKGSGNPTFYTTSDVVTEMLLIEDEIGHRLYKTVAELATALRVSNIVEVEPMAGYKLDINNEEKPLVGVIVNLKDYNVGRNDKAGRDFFSDFDIDYNQYKYLYEERFSGALVKPFSALTVYLDGEEES